MPAACTPGCGPATSPDGVFFNADYSDSRENYDNWQVSLSRELVGVTRGISYVDTDLSDAECLLNRL